MKPMNDKYIAVLEAMISKLRSDDWYARTFILNQKYTETVGNGPVIEIEDELHIKIFKMESST